MKTKMRASKLKMSRETLHRLNERALAAAQGAGYGKTTWTWEASTVTDTRCEATVDGDYRTVVC